MISIVTQYCYFRLLVWSQPISHPYMWIKSWRYRVTGINTICLGLLLLPYFVLLVFYTLTELFISWWQLVKSQVGGERWSHQRGGGDWLVVMWSCGERLPAVSSGVCVGMSRGWGWPWHTAHVYLFWFCIVSLLCCALVMLIMYCDNLRIRFLWTVSWIMNFWIPTYPGYHKIWNSRCRWIV